LTDGCEHPSEAEADQEQAGHEGDDARPRDHEPDQQRDADEREQEAPHDQRLLRAPLGESLRASDEIRGRPVAA
jgi:hypothetical protein